ncbi:MAG TPA: hypothetical protein VFN35_27175, partial [Ktedonobacteraceae bacterium]|nr:hypothetical protein [Ktedonobacteraceae bacterium]
ILEAAKSRFAAHRLSEALDVLQSDENFPTLFLRHDLKISLNRALPLAEIEHECGIPATYMVRVDSPLYSLTERHARVHLLELIQMGHEVGLHFDLISAEQQSPSFLKITAARLHTACERLEQLICRPVRTISFQRSIPLLFNGPLSFEGRLNADSRELRGWCISDAEGEWSNGEPIASITRLQSPILQLLLHPIWWGKTHLPAPQRLQEFFDLVTGEKHPRDAGIFDINLARTLPAVRRQGICSIRSRGVKA